MKSIFERYSVETLAEINKARNERMEILSLYLSACGWQNE